MRVIAGIYKRRALRNITGLDVRPTASRLRETLFDILMPQIPNSRFLDICAGSGAIGIEALSRGATHVTLIESSRRAIQVIYENLHHCEINTNIEVLYLDAIIALKQLSNRVNPFNIAYFDPPYNSNIYIPILTFLDVKSLLVPNGILGVEHHNKLTLPTTVGRLHCYRQIRQGQSLISFYKNSL